MGMELALAGGYSARQGLRAYQRMDELWGRSSFHSLTSDHPSSKDRLAQMDKEQAPLWRAMSAFEDGVCFLAAEQYAAAGASFSMVTREFPQSHEAWANLGYAKLMMYADGLETADLRKLGVPHIAVGGFYARPASLQAKVRGINRALWQEALSALQNADRLNPNQALVKANLGVAYLVSPDGPDAARAVGYLRAAINLATSDPPLPALGLTAITANHAAAVFLSGTDPSFPLLLKSVELAWKGIPERAHAFRVMTASSLLYTSAAYQSSVRTQESAEAAVSNYEEYLQITHPASAWWPLAYERYTAAAAQVGQKPKPKEAFATPLHQIMRELTTVNLAGGRAVVLGQPVEELRKQFPQATRLPAFQGSNLARYRLDTGGADVLADDRVLAIVLNSASSPPVPVQSMGVSGRGVTLRVSMTEDALDALLKDQDFNFQTLLDRRIPYRFYPYLGLGVKVDNGVVKELLIVRIPRQS
jgi:tetratricopeptide (TPR) repeat protein